MCWPFPNFAKGWRVPRTGECNPADRVCRSGTCQADLPSLYGWLSPLHPPSFSCGEMLTGEGLLREQVVIITRRPAVSLPHPSKCQKS